MYSMRRPRSVFALLTVTAVGLLHGCWGETPEVTEISAEDLYAEDIKNEALRALFQIEQQPGAAQMAADEYATVTGELYEDDEPPDTEHAATIQQLNDGIRELGTMSDANEIRSKAQELRTVAESLPGEIYLDVEEGGPPSGDGDAGELDMDEG